MKQHVLSFLISMMGLNFTMSQLVVKHWELDKDIINEPTGFEKAYMRVKIFTRLQCGTDQNPNLQSCLSEKLTSTRS